jgi:uncharacterized protein YdeI (YjbR/CyaY-like superfamily)
MPTSRPAFFETPAEFRKWLEQHHAAAKELLVGFWKKGSGRPSITWSESVDQALCFGWIDGVRRSVDDDSYSIRFTPRRPESNWSTVNIARVKELERLKLMRPAGRRAFEARSTANSGIYSYEQRKSIVLDAALEKRLKANKAAWTFLQEVAPSYRQLTIFWVMSAKADDTRRRRLDKLIEASARQQRLI